MSTLGTVINVLKVKAWAELLYASTGADSISGAEKFLFGPLRFRKTEAGNFARPGILRRWLNGTEPHEVTLLRMDQRVPGSQDLFNHPLWEIAICRGTPPVRLLYSLMPGVGAILFQPDCRGSIWKPSLNEMDVSSLHRLQSIPSIDALAALLYCVKRGQGEGHCELATHALQSFYRLALCLGVFKPFADVVAPLIAIVCAGFSLQPWPGLRWLASEQIEKFAAELRTCLAAEFIQQASQVEPGTLSWVQSVDLIATWFDTGEKNLKSNATRLCPLLEPANMDVSKSRLFGNRSVAYYLAIEELNAPCHWELATKHRRKKRVHISEGLVIGSSYETLCS